MGAVGPDPTLVPGRAGGSPAHQRPRRDGGRKTCLPRRVSPAALHRGCRRVLRVGFDARRAREATLLDPSGRRAPVRLRRHLGPLDGQAERDGVVSCAIITTDPVEVVRPVHDRMPAILRPAAYDSWTNPETPADALVDLLRTPDGSKLNLHPVSARVNSPRHEEADCIQPVPATGRLTPPRSPGSSARSRH